MRINKVNAIALFHLRVVIHFDNIFTKEDYHFIFLDSHLIIVLTGGEQAHTAASCHDDYDRLAPASRRIYSRFHFAYRMLSRAII